MYQLANNLEIFKTNNPNQIRFIKRGTGLEQLIECDNNGLNFLNQLKKANGKINKELAQNFPQIVDFLLEKKILAPQATTTVENQYRSQLQAFEDLDLNSHASQNKISKAKVAIIGCGGTGGWLATQLVAMGVTQLHLIDPDVVESSNIVRQVYNLNQVGKNKVDALEELLKQKNTHIKLKKSKFFVNEESNLHNLFDQYDYICIAADYPSRAEMGLLIGNWCLAHKKTHFICGGYSGHNSALGLTVIPGKTNCWSCYRKWYATQVPIETLNEPFLKGPKNTSGLFPLVLLAAAMSCYDIIRVIIGMNPVLVNTRIDLNPETLNFEKIPFSPDQECISCRRSHEIAKRN